MTHVPYLSEEEQRFLNTTASYSKARRMSCSDNSRPSHLEENQTQLLMNRRHQVVSVSSLAFLWKRRGSSSSSLVSSNSSRSMDLNTEDEESPKARELELLIFDQPQRTVRLSLTPRCAV
ncbi:hypothetical protein BD770DRAFT_394520 [Pilaira anomala]|nr:hypothetical protein BD770DRAFT_394520 [Pilaira anomala]